MRTLLLLFMATSFYLGMNAQETDVIKAKSDISFSYKLYPNPADDKVVLELPGTNVILLEIYNSQARLVLGGPVLQGTNTIYLNGLPAGAYVFRMQSADGLVVIERLIKY